MCANFLTSVSCQPWVCVFWLEKRWQFLDLRRCRGQKDVHRGAERMGALTVVCGSGGAYRLPGERCDGCVNRCAPPRGSALGCSFSFVGKWVVWIVWTKGGGRPFENNDAQDFTDPLQNGSNLYLYRWRFAKMSVPGFVDKSEFLACRFLFGLLKLWLV